MAEEPKEIKRDINSLRESFQVIQFSGADNPQPMERINKSKGWVDYGIDNQYPKYLQSLMNRSPLHSSIVTKKARMVGGYGFLKTNLDVRTMMFLKNPRNDHDLDEILYRCAYDLEVYGAFALNVIWSKDRETITEINYVDVAKVRVQSPEDETKYPQIENYWVCDGWENVRKYPPVLYQGFSTRSKKKTSQIYYVKEQRAGVEYYGIPCYLPGVRWMETDWLISDFHNANIKNGMAPSYIVQWPLFNASPEEKAFLADRLRKEYTNSFNTGRIVVSFVDDPSQAPKFEPIEMNDSDGRFMLLKDQSRESILESHQIDSPMLFGIETPGKLGGRNERLEALEAFQHSYMTPKQNILEKIFNRLARVNGITDNLIINRYSEEFRSIDTNMKDILDVLTAPIEASQKYWLLVQNGYTHQVAAKLTSYTDGNDKTIEDTVDKPTEVQQSKFNKAWDNIKHIDSESYYEEESDVFNIEKFSKDVTKINILTNKIKNNQ